MHVQCCCQSVPYRLPPLPRFFSPFAASIHMSTQIASSGGQSRRTLTCTSRRARGRSGRGGGERVGVRGEGNPSIANKLYLSVFDAPPHTHTLLKGRQQVRKTKRMEEGDSVHNTGEYVGATAAAGDLGGILASILPNIDQIISRSSD